MVPMWLFNLFLAVISFILSCSVSIGLLASFKPQSGWPVFLIGSGLFLFSFLGVKAGLVHRDVSNQQAILSFLEEMEDLSRIEAAL